MIAYLTTSAIFPKVSNIAVDSEQVTGWGIADANASVSVAVNSGQAITTQADNTGRFSLNVPLEIGRNDVVFSSGSNTQTVTIFRLITDRNGSDVQQLQSLVGIPYQQMSQEQQDFYLNQLVKGAYNLTSDGNRVNEAIAVLSQELENAGYPTGISTQLATYVYGAQFSNIEAQEYLSTVSGVREAYVVLFDTPQVPGSMAEMGYEEANDIEQIIVDADKALAWSRASYRALGGFTFDLGQEVVLPHD